MAEILFIKDHPSVQTPVYETAGAAGFDLRAHFGDNTTSVVALHPNETILIQTGLRVAIPPGFEMQIRSRSGLAFKHNVIVLNSPGTVDSDYRGPIGIILHNVGREPFVIKHGDRIAQGVVAPVVQANFRLVDALPQTKRGAGGFGSTGTN